MVQKLDCVIACNVYVPSDDMLNNVACVDMPKIFINGIFWCGIALLDFFGNSSISLALCGSCRRLAVLITSLPCTTNERIW